MKRVIFFQVKNSKEKIPYICNIAKKQFDLNHRLLIRTSNETSSQFINKILWSYPSTSFLPHQISLTPCEEIICITHLPLNPNGAKVCFNLTDKSLLDDCFTVIYDFESPRQAEAGDSNISKLNEYKEAQFSIASF